MHKQDFVRHAFIEWAERGGLEDTITIGNAQYTVDWLIGRLWHCTDILPSSTCASLGMPRGSSYAQAVQALRTRSRNRVPLSGSIQR
jgi:hypothetical protein